MNTTDTDRIVQAIDRLTRVIMAASVALNVLLVLFLHK
jgi:hypothetical protein